MADTSADKSSPSQPTFHLFKGFPVEIRLLIWKFALPGPRIVHLRYLDLKERQTEAAEDDNASDVDSLGELTSRTRIRSENGEGSEVEFRDSQGGTNTNSNIDSKFRRGFRSSCPPPVLIYVCRESFMVVCENYDCMFSTPHAFAETWFDCKRDTLYLDWGWDHHHPWRRTNNRRFNLENFVANELSHVRYLAISDRINFDNGALSHIVTGWESCEQWIAKALHWFPNVHTITFSRLVFKDRDMIDQPSSFANLKSVSQKVLEWGLWNGYTDMDPEVGEYSLIVVQEQIFPFFINFQSLDWERLKYVGQDSKNLRTLPKLEFKMFVTSEMEQRINIIESAWAERRPDWESRLGCISSKIFSPV